MNNVHSLLTILLYLRVVPYFLAFIKLNRFQKKIL